MTSKVMRIFGAKMGGRAGIAPRVGPVSYANDPRRLLSATPATPIGAVAGVADRRVNLSVA
jgi:hypothetical protein